MRQPGHHDDGETTRTGDSAWRCHAVSPWVDMEHTVNSFGKQQEQRRTEDISSSSLGIAGWPIVASIMYVVSVKDLPLAGDQILFLAFWLIPGLSVLS
jgi:hypothetical protein